MFGIKTSLRLLRNRLIWDKIFPGTLTVPGNWFPPSILSVGEGTYGVLNIVWNNTNACVKIGRWCSIATDVSFVVSSEHNTDTATTYPFRMKLLGQEKPEAGTKGGIVLADDVWVGHRATILDGVCIGQGAIVAAGALVTKDVQPYEIVGGCPARHIRWRYDEDIRSLMQSFDWAKVDKLWVERHIDALYESPLTLDTARHLLEELPQ